MRRACTPHARWPAAAPASLVRRRVMAAMMPAAPRAISAVATPSRLLRMVAQRPSNEVGETIETYSEWETVPHWCELCAEPVNWWQNHLGKRDHMCLELIVNTIVQDRGLWDSEEVHEGIEVFREHYMHGPRDQPRTSSRVAQRLLKEGLYVPGVHSPLNLFFDAYDRGDPCTRREELHLLLLYLRDRGVVSLTADTISTAVYQGNQVLQSELMPLISRTFPVGEVGGVSAILQTITSAFNMLHVFELCGMQSFLSPTLLQRRGVRPGLLSALSGMGDAVGDAEAGDSAGGEWRLGNSGDDAADADGDDGAAGAAGGEIATSASEAAVYQALASVAPRAVLGCLRWSIATETTPPPPAVVQDGRRNAYITTLAARAARLLISEIVFARMTELMTRAEFFLGSEFGMEWSRVRVASRRLSAKGGGGGGSGRSAPLRLHVAPSIVPSLSNMGCVTYTQGGFSAHAITGSTASELVIRQQDKARESRLSTRRNSVKSSLNTPMSRGVRAM